MTNPVFTTELDGTSLDVDESDGLVSIAVTCKSGTVTVTGTLKLSADDEDSSAITLNTTTLRGVSITSKSSAPLVGITIDATNGVAAVVGQ